MKSLFGSSKKEKRLKEREAEMRVWQDGAIAKNVGPATQTSRPVDLRLPTQKPSVPYAPPVALPSRQKPQNDVPHTPPPDLSIKSKPLDGAQLISAVDTELKAREAIFMGLPRGWRVTRDTLYNECFYVNIHTGKTQWQHPLPDGWKSRWDSAHNEWFYINLKTGKSQWQAPYDPDPEELPRTDHNNRARGGRIIASQTVSEKAEWYIEDPSALPEHHPDYLCKTCRHIDLEFLFFESRLARTAPATDYIRLGPLPEIARQTTCAFCRIVYATIKLRVDLERARLSSQDDGELQRLLNAEWYLSPFRFYDPQYPLGWQLFMRHSIYDEDQQEDTTHMLSSHPFALRVVVDEPRGGRRLPLADHLDFAWIQRTIELCELSTDMPPRELEYPIRAIDTLRMCIIELSVYDEYVALSYPWGGVKQLRLTTENEPSFVQPGSLTKSYNQLAKTIQDAIVLVSKVGMRYLWVDSLSILQDDKTSVSQQMNQMGEIYRNAHFTIFAISGNDANYGLPGVRQGTRKFKQALEEINGMTIINSLPQMDGDNRMGVNGSWVTRAWTYQEKFQSQRGVYIGDYGVTINCLHTNGPEDEHDWHTQERDDQMISTGHTIFFEGQDTRCEPRIRGGGTPFDSFAFFVSEYSERKLTYETDIIPAFLGVFHSLESSLGTEFVQGIPEVEFDAGLLWSPIGPSIRREGYPSWSWLGWKNAVAWPWTVERDTFISIEGSPLRWLDAGIASENQRIIPKTATRNGKTIYVQDGTYSLKENSTTDAAWFTSDDLCLPPSQGRAGILRRLQTWTDDHLKTRSLCKSLRREPSLSSDPRVQWPDGLPPSRRYTLGTKNRISDHRLTLKTLSAKFYVVGPPWKRPALYNMKHTVWQQAVCDADGCQVGYIDVSHANSSTAASLSGLGCREFIVLSRSTVDGRFDPAPDEMTTSRRKTPLVSQQMEFGRSTLGAVADNHRLRSIANDQLSTKGWFDKTVYDDTRPWCMFNVMMLTNGEVKERAAIGRIHVDAFLAHRPVSKVIELH